MIERFRLTVPDSLTPSLYWSSCRAVLVLTTCLGLQAIVVLMIGIGPLGELAYDPAELTGAGRFFLSAEYDTQAYATGCVSTLILACAGLWSWNRHLIHTEPERAQFVARWGACFQLGLAVLSFAVFWGLLASIGPGLADSRRVPIGDLLLLASPACLTLGIVVSAYGLAWRAKNRQSS
jgi:hypothetical protein